MQEEGGGGGVMEGEGETNNEGGNACVLWCIDTWVWLIRLTKQIIWKAKLLHLL